MLYPLAGGSAGAGNYAVALPSCKGKGRRLDCLPFDTTPNLALPFVALPNRERASVGLF